ncbi:MAG: hypothetical protein RL368_1235 [Pseudomonadota bacterium]
MSFIKVILSFVLLCSFAVSAHDDVYLDKQKSPHGGQVRMAGAYHFELVLSPKQVTIYVTDHAGMAVKTEGAQASVVILANKQKVSLELKVAGENSLQASGDYPTSPEMKAVVSIQIKGQEMQQARFTPWEKFNSKP